MKIIDLIKLKRDPNKVKNLFKVNPNNTLVTKPVYVVFPLRFVKKNLAILSNDGIRLLGNYAIVTEDDYYSVMNKPIYQDLLPSFMEEQTIDGVEYMVCEFLANSIFFTTNKFIVTDSFTYDLLDEYFSKGNVPWYMNYEDVSRIFETSSKYAGTGIGNQTFIFEILTSIISRNKINKTLYYRQTQAKDKSLAYVGLNDIRYGFDNTGARLIGGYFKEGIVTSIVNPETKTSLTSQILRS